MNLFSLNRSFPFLSYEAVMIASVVMVTLISLKRLFVAASMKNVSRFLDVRRKQSCLQYTISCRLRLSEPITSLFSLLPRLLIYYLKWKTTVEGLEVS